MFNNKTRNQHYISQVEQKLNCINSSIAKEKRRIYQFKALDRESLEYKLSNEIGVKIENNLSFNDLYSLEIFDDATRDGRNGAKVLPMLLETHTPLDQVVLMLGTNDCKAVNHASAKVIGKGIEKLILQIRAFSKEIPILLISPILL